MIIDFPSKYDSSITYYGIGYLWTNNAGTPASVVSSVSTYRTLMGIGV